MPNSVAVSKVACQPANHAELPAFPAKDHYAGARKNLLSSGWKPDGSQRDKQNEPIGRWRIFRKYPIVVVPAGDSA